MIGLTGSHICPLCGYKLPVQTITYTTGTEPYKDWIVRYYGSHDDIPPGHTDGELTELIRCKNCKWYEKDIGCDWGVCFHDEWTYNGYIGHGVDSEGYCYRAERKEE